jgi:hypothetical protein
VPLVPVMVNVRVRFWTFDCVATVSTDVPEFTIEAGEKLAVPRGGAPVTERFTVPENPGPAVIVTVYVAVPPLVIVLLAGVTAIEKSPPTTSVTFTVCATGPLAPLIVRAYEPGGVAAVVETLSVVEPDAVTDPGLNEAVAPEGRPLTLKSTMPLNPVPPATVAV